MQLTEAAIVQALSLSQKALLTEANNLANAETPGYQAERWSFRAALAQAIAMGPNAVLSVAGTPVPDPGATQANGNTVSITRSMTALAQDQVYYDTAVAAWQHWQNGIKAVAEGKAL
ncbi:MAG: flagellar basal body protein [Firmicutes bacterium]|nr:flagellar basal body rod protein [Alicyclobacillaceae bacterium]MCL6497284.1 flagellar basal body protein [Bacillota bacterium]